MRYYSDELKKFFDTEEALLSAEETARQNAEKAKETKAKLAKEVQDASNVLDEAYKSLEKAKDEVAKLQAEYNDKVDAIMNPARDAVKAAAKARSEAICKFNQKYGPYTTVYTGNKAEVELNKFESVFDSLLKFPFWL